MNKVERLKLHSVLIRLADNQEAIVDRLDAIDASQVMLGSLVLQNEEDLKNILHVCKETQRQIRLLSGPDLKVVHDSEAITKPAE